MIFPATLFFLSALFATADSTNADEIRVKSQLYVPQPLYTVRVDTKLVEIGAVVRDSKGHEIAGLSKEQFHIQDNGKKRDIAHFSADASSLPGGVRPSTNLSQNDPPGKADVNLETDGAQPRFIALYLDDINAKDEQHVWDLKETKDAAEKFVREALQPGIKVGIFTASGTPMLDFTADLAKLVETLRNVKPHMDVSEHACVTPYLAYMIAFRNDPTAYGEVAAQSASSCYPKAATRSEIKGQAEETWRRVKELSTGMLESIGLLADHLGTMPGARVLVLASSGFITAGLDQQRDRIVARALHSGVVINTLDAKGLYGEPSPFGGRATDGQSVALTGPRVAAGLQTMKFNSINLGLRVETMNEPLAALAEGTGGLFFHNDNDLHAGFRKLALPPAVTYRLSFRADDIPANGSYHRLKVTLDSRHESLQARKGYFAPDEKSTSEGESLQSRFDQEVLAKDTISDFPIGISAQKGNLPGGETTISIVVRVKIDSLPFAKQGGRRTQKIRFVTALTGVKDTAVIAKEATMDLALKEDTYQRLAKTGLNAKLTLQVKPGVYDLREVVQETTGKIACSTHSIEIK